jgi:peptidoglycan hydrolase CwlO-like protein
METTIVNYILLGIITLGVASYLVWLGTRLNNLMEWKRDFQRDNQDQVNDIHTRIENVDRDVYNSLDNRFTEVSRDIDRMDSRFDRRCQEIDTETDKRMDAIWDEINKMQEVVS